MIITVLDNELILTVFADTYRGISYLPAAIEYPSD